MGDVERLTAEVARLSAQVEALTAALAKDIGSPYGNVIIHEKRTHTYAANLAEPRRLIDYRSKNTTTGAAVTVKNFSALQLERAAFKFAKLEQPARKHWHGDRWLYGFMVKLFAQHGGIVRHHGSRCWRWAAWPHQRREIAGRIAASLARP